MKAKLTKEERKELLKAVGKGALEGLLLGVGLSAIYYLGMWKGIIGTGITYIKYLENEFPEDFTHVQNVLRADESKIDDINKYIPDMSGFLMIHQIRDFKQSYEK